MTVASSVQPSLDATLATACSSLADTVSVIVVPVRQVPAARAVTLTDRTLLPATLTLVVASPRQSLCPVAVTVFVPAVPKRTRTANRRMRIANSVEGDPPFDRD